MRHVFCAPCYLYKQVVVDDFDEEHKARLLQFVTGTSGVVCSVKYSYSVANWLAGTSPRLQSSAG